VAAVMVVAAPRLRGRRGPSPLAAALVAQPEPTELETWALSDPLEDQEEQAVEDGSVEQDDGTDLDLDSESME